MIKNLFKNILCAALIISAAACTEPHKEELADNSLTVTPDAGIEFGFKENEDYVLTVETDAVTWDFDVSDEWILAQRLENSLTVNVTDNAGDEREGTITVTAGNAAPVVIGIIQEKAEEPVLSVIPSDDIRFQAEGGETIVLTVETNVASWEYTVPEWVTASKEGNTLSVTAMENKGSERPGRITVSAEGAKDVRINVIQEKFDPTSIKVSLADNEGNRNGDMVIETMNDIYLPLTATLDKKAVSDAGMTIIYDENYVTTYNHLNGTDYQAYPKELVSIGNDGRITVAAEEKSASTTVTLDTKGYSLRNNVTYLVPLLVKPDGNSGITAPSATSRVNYTIARKCKKEVRNVVFIDTKDTNPLNILELRLEDGSMMVDALILFAANINWDSYKQEVVVRNNGSVQPLLDKNETYLQPLRKAGIKVWLCILGNHDGAGIANLSEMGASNYARTLAETVRKYNLDGICFDDEYSKYGELAGPWFTGASRRNACRLLYYTKKTMKEIVPWDTQISVYQYGHLTNLEAIDGHQPGEFVDVCFADYPNGAATMQPGMTKQQLAGGSYEMNLHRGMQPGSVGAVKSKGYGWMMWFSYCPQRDKGDVKDLQVAADLLYNIKLPDPQYIYKKGALGTEKDDFDPNPYPFSL